MSRRENASTGGSNSPIEVYLRWHGDGHVEYYDKAKSENVEQKDLEIVMLDIRNSITGWSEDNKSKITSNMVKDTSKEELTVKPFKGREIATGLWKDIKDTVQKADGKFTVNLIGLAKVGGEWKIANLQLVASNLAEWMNFRDTTTEAQIYDAMLYVSAGERRKKGATKFTVPAFELKKLDAKTDALAEEAYKKVKAYFNQDGRASNAAPELAKAAASNSAPAASNEDPDSDLPF